MISQEAWDRKETGPHVFDSTTRLLGPIVGLYVIIISFSVADCGDFK